MGGKTQIEDLIQGLHAGEVRFLSKAITLIESKAGRDMLLADQLMNELDTSKVTSHRIAVTGVPGVGKSTFIERLGLHYISQGKKVAVLAIDPSSRFSHGSILGDKTRMEKLSVEKNAFIRPSPAAETLGGVAQKTRESILLCESAGYDIIIVETVGVGQSEIAVKDMVDTFLLLMLAGAGDELQGIKRGIMEMADILVIHKAEEEVIGKARDAASQYRSALHLLGSHSTWNPKVELMSSYTGLNEEKVFVALQEHLEFLRSSGDLEEQRKLQQSMWFEKSLDEEILRSFFGKEAFRTLKEECLEGMRSGRISSRSALNLIKKGSGLGT